MWAARVYRAAAGKGGRAAFRGDVKTEGPMKGGGTLAERMKRLGMKVLPGFGLSIEFVVLDSEKWGRMELEEKKRARVATKELRSGRGMSRERRKRLLGESIPLRRQRMEYPDFESALRATAEHIPESKKQEKEKILGVVGGIRKLNRRLNESKGGYGARRLGRTVRELQNIVEKLELRNSVYLVDQQADLAGEVIPEAIGLLGENKWWIACTKLVQAINVLEEKIMHDEEGVSRRSAERTRLIEELMEFRDSPKRKIRGVVGTLDSLVKQLRASASSKERTVAWLERCLRVIDSNFRVSKEWFYNLPKGGRREKNEYVGPEELAACLKRRSAGELKQAGDLLYGGDSARARTLVFSYLESVGGGTMPVRQRSRIANELLKVEKELKGIGEVFRDTEGGIIAEAAKCLRGMAKLAVQGKPHEALQEYDELVRLGR